MNRRSAACRKLNSSATTTKVLIHHSSTRHLLGTRRPGEQPAPVVVARQQIFHDPQRPSRIHLTVAWVSAGSNRPPSAACVGGTTGGHGRRGRRLPASHGRVNE